MKKTIIAILFGALLSGCVAHAHTPHHSPHSDELVKAWVWDPGHYRTNGVWVRGSWDIRFVERYKFSRYPRTHVRWIQGRRRPAPPAQRRHRFPRRR